MNRFVEQYTKLTQGMKEADKAAVRSELERAFSAAMAFEAREMTVEDNEGYLAELCAKMRQKNPRTGSLVDNPVLAEFRGVCQNVTFSDAELEGLVRKISSERSGPLIDGQEDLLADYVRYRKPGQWFWEWWEEYLGQNAGWNIRETDWILLNMYIEHHDATPEQVEDIIGRFKLWNVAEIYSLPWVSVEQCRKWFKAVDRQAYSDGSEYRHDWSVLYDIYQQNPERAASLVSGHMLGQALTDNLDDEWREMLTYFLQNLSEKAVVLAFRKSHPTVWNYRYADTLPEIFAGLRAKVKATILELAPAELKQRLIGSIGRGSKGRGAGTKR